MTTLPDSLPAVAETLTRIFSELPTDVLSRHSTPREGGNSPGGVRDSKRRKSGPAIEVLFAHKEVLGVVNPFLDPLSLLAWSSCCKASRAACSLDVKLDSVFQWFHVDRRYTDRLHKTSCDWKVVYKLLLQAATALTNVYGPFNVHPLHAAAAGEIILSILADSAERRPYRSRPTFIGPGHKNPNLGQFYLATVVIGQYGEYLWHEDGEDDGLEEYIQLYVKTGEAAPRLPAGPAREMIQHHKFPIISVFKKEREETTDEFGLNWPIQRETEEGVFPATYTTTGEMKVYSLNYQDLEPETEGLDEFVDWLSNWPPYQNCTTLAHAFCQYVPLTQVRVTQPLDSWTQLVRAGWLRAHGMAPFDDSEAGKKKWNDVVQSLPEDIQSLLKRDLTSEEVAGFAHEVINDAYNEQVRERVKKSVLIYLRLDHSRPKGSDYYVRREATDSI